VGCRDIYDSLWHVLVVAYVAEDGLCPLDNVDQKICCWERVHDCWEEDGLIDHFGLGLSYRALVIDHLEKVAPFE